MRLSAGHGKQRSARAMRNTQKMLADAWQPRRVWPTMIEGRAITSGSPGISRNRRSPSSFEAVYGTLQFARVLVSRARLRRFIHVRSEEHTSELHSPDHLV